MQKINGNKPPIETLEEREPLPLEAEQEAADGEPPTLFLTLGRGIYVGAIGGALCNFVVISILGLLAVIGNLRYGISGGDIATGIAFYALSLFFGTIVAGPIGMALGAASATLMWLVLRFLDMRDTRARMLVGVGCTLMVTLFAITLVLASFVQAGAWGWGDFAGQGWTWILLLEGVVVIATGGWFAMRFLGDETA